MCVRSESRVENFFKHLSELFNVFFILLNYGSTYPKKTQKKLATFRSHNLVHHQYILFNHICLQTI